MVPDRALTLKKAKAVLAQSRLMQWAWSDRYLVIYRSSRAEAAAIAPPPQLMNINNLADLEKFDQSERWLPLEAFLATARKRIADGEMVFSATMNGRLRYYCWLVPEQRKGYFPWVDQEYIYPPGSAVMYNAYCHPEARNSGLHQLGLKSMVAWAFSRPGTDYLYGAIDLANIASRHCSEKIGRKPYEVLYRKCRFGRVEKGSLPPSFAAEYDAGITGE